MVEVLTRFLPDAIVDNIAAYAAINWEKVIAREWVWNVEHLVIHRSGRDSYGSEQGGYVYLYRDREPGWYKWKAHYEPPVYTKIDGTIAWWDYDFGSNYKIAVVPHDYVPDNEDNTKLVMSAQVMERH